MSRRERYLPIGEYGLLSDCHSAALVSREGSIDWACFRRFDHGSSFARILDRDRGGFFAIRPVEEIQGRARRYVPSTMVLETTLDLASGSLGITDAFAMRQGGSRRPRGQLLRVAEVSAGELTISVVIEPRFDYGATRPWLREHGEGRFSAVGGSDALVVHSGLPLAIDRTRFRLEGTVRLRAGAKLAVTVVAQPAHLVDPEAADVRDVDMRLAETIEWWERWSDATRVDGPHAETLSRSVLVLKSLTCAPTGAIVAAPTTSLPEVVGGDRNWDYRCSWIRDSTLALDALAAVGHEEVAQGFRNFVMRSAAGHGDDLQIMYGPYGAHRLTEVTLDLEGWRGSRLVRIGNQAATQTQLDVYGHLLDAVHLWHGKSDDIDEDEWRFLITVVDKALELRHQPDQGIWESRGAPRHHVHSKVMLWVAVDRGIRLVEDLGLAGEDVDLPRWRHLREEIRREIESRGVDPRRGHFVSSYGTTEVDASLLKLPLVGFIDASDPRMRATVDVIMRDLSLGSPGVLRRFRQEDGEQSREGVFLLCSFWLVEVLALEGRVEEATELFDRLLGLGNDLGLFAEQYDVAEGELLGNFPQAFSHIGIIAAEKRLRAATTTANPGEMPRRRAANTM
jgi:GH15 family glucan-1,4-alpha-glucosidase